MSVRILTGKAAHLLRLAVFWRRVASRAYTTAQKDSDLAQASILFHRAMAEGGAQ